MNDFAIGAAGMMGSNFVHHRPKSDIEFKLFNALTDSKDIKDLTNVREKIEFVKGDIWVMLVI
jgi:dTDP-D-glucose 4,6-dehydratase